MVAQGKMKRLAALFALVLAAAAGAEPVPVAVTTTDGREIRGTVPPESLRVAVEGKEIPLADMLEVEFSNGAALVLLANRSRVEGKSESKAWTVTCALGDVSIAADQLRVVRLRPAPVRVEGSDGSVEPAVATLRLNSCLAGSLVFSPDGSSLIGLNASDATLFVVSSSDLHLVSSVELPQGASSWSLSADGKTAAVCARKSICIVDVAAATASRTFEIEVAPTDILAIDSETVLVLGDNSLCVVSASRQSIVRRDRTTGGVRFAVTPDRSKAYAGNTSFLLPSTPPARAEDFVPVPTPLTYGYGAATPLTFTTDGRLALDRNGQLRRPGRSYLADMADCGKLEPNLAAVSLPAAGRLMAFTAEGTAKAWDLTTLEVRGTWKLGRRIWSALADEKRGILFLFHAQGNAGPSYQQVPISPAGDLVVVPIPR